MQVPGGGMWGTAGALMRRAQRVMRRARRGAEAVAIDAAIIFFADAYAIIFAMLLLRYAITPY